MDRKTYLLEQKQKYGRHVVAVFPAQYPKEILWALNIVPAEIWDPPLEVSGAAAHLQPYICSVVKLGLELILAGKTDFVDAYLFPHTCDSVQNMASVVYDYIGAGKPCYFFYHPKAPYFQPARDYYLAQLKVLAADLEKQFGRLDPAELARRVAQGREIAAVLKDLYDRRAEGTLDCGNAEFYQVVRRGEYLWPDDFLAELTALADRPLRTTPASGPAVILSGVLPNPAGILDLLEQHGVRVAGDDFINGSRRLLIPPSDKSDPFEALANSYFQMPPCSTKDSSIDERVAFLLDMVRRARAGGVIFYVVKFCETELFDLPNLVEELKAAGVPTLSLDVEVNEPLSGRLATRIEAFIEMIG